LSFSGVRSSSSWIGVPATNFPFQGLNICLVSLTSTSSPGFNLPFLVITSPKAFTKVILCCFLFVVGLGSHTEILLVANSLSGI